MTLTLRVVLAIGAAIIAVAVLLGAFDEEQARALAVMGLVLAVGLVVP